MSLQDAPRWVQRNPFDLEAERQLSGSDLFDPDWYRQTQAPDLPTERDSARHYLQDGAALGLSPGPLFDGPWYLERNPDVAAAGMNPLVHYLQCGHEEGRATCPVADPAEVALVATSYLFDRALPAVRPRGRPSDLPCRRPG
ncbi:hypothetical protein ASF39_18240 [Methylobacterium sp. Leaf108]|nr:hypothetical protein ASF39_18240 [Methylobacterium sp. Leaf108]